MVISEPGVQILLVMDSAHSINTRAVSHVDLIDGHFWNSPIDFCFEEHSEKVPVCTPAYLFNVDKYPGTVSYHNVCS